MEDQQEQLRRSVEVLQQDFNVFVQGMQEQGWEVSKLVLKIPDNAPILSEIICWLSVFTLGFLIQYLDMW